MKKKIIGILVCTLLIVAAVFPVAVTENINDYETVNEVYCESDKEWIPFIPDSEPGSLSEVKLKSIATSELMVDSDIPGMYTEDVEIENETYQRLEIPNEGYTDEVGKPKIPIIKRYLEIPYDVNLSVEIYYSDPEDLEDYNIIPVEELIPIFKTKEMSEVVEDNEAYSNDDFYPPYIAAVAEPVIMRGHRIVELTLCPIQFNAVDQLIRVCSKIEVKAKYTHPAQIEGIEERLESDAYERLLKAFVLNYKCPGEYVSRRDNPPNLSPGADYLIITHNNFATQVQPLKEWKQKKGYKTEVKTYSGTITANAIKTYIQNAYDNWNPPPTYILLVGDVKLDSGADSIPTYYGLTSPYGGDQGRIGTDLWYARLDGSDYYPDVFIGRLPANTTAEADTVVNKILTYEKNPNWQGHGLICRSTEFPNDECASIINLLTNKGYTHTKVEVTPGGVDWAATQQIKDTINNGCFIVSQYDHGDSFNGPGGVEEGWWDPRFTTNNVSQLTNNDKLPIMFSMNCRTGWFDGETDDDSTDPSGGVDCLGEAWLNSNNKGGVGFIGSSRVAWNGYTVSLHLGFYDAIWPDFLPITQNAMYELGQILTYGKINMVLDYGISSLTTKVELEEFNLFGDPEMSIWTSQPQPLDASYPNMIGSGGSQKFWVKVTDGPPGYNPLSHALVCLQKGTDVHVSGYTNAGGYINFDITPSSGGNMDITVTKHNYLPYEGNIVVTSNGAIITISPNSGHSGSTFTMTGSNFGGNEIVDYFVGGIPCGSITTTSGGSFTTTVTVPTIPSGPANVVAVGTPSGRAAVADFFVNPGQPDPCIYSQKYLLSQTPPLPVTWDNPDIVLYDTSTGFSVPSRDLILGTEYEINATIHNEATISAVNTKVTFYWAHWDTSPGTWLYLGNDTITVPASGTEFASTNWTPIVTGHSCILVEIYHPSDSITINNTGQENTHVYPITSPGEITIDITNPTNESALVCLEVIQNGGERQELWGTQIERPYPQVLDPEETQTATFTVNAPDDAEVGETRTFTIVATIDGETIGGVECRVVKLMELTKPKANHLYLFGFPIPFPWTVIIGPITIEVDAKDFECGIDRVEFYIDDKLQSNDTEPPYEWTWRGAFFKHTLKVITYNKCGISDSREMQVWKFF